MTRTARTIHEPAQDRAAIRVLHVRTVRGNGGGPEKTILLGARYLPPLGVRSEALYLLDANTPSHALLDRLEASGMPVHVVHERSALDVAGPAAFARLVRQGRFDIVHAHDYKSNTLARFLAATGTYRIVATAHGYNQTTTREAYYYALEKLLLRRADAVICPSAQLADLLADSGVSRRRLSVVSNGIELDAWTFRPRRRHDTPVRVLYVGRLSPEKNIADLLRAVARLNQAGCPVHLSLAGDGPQRDDLSALAAEMGLVSPAGAADATATARARVEFLGHRGDVSELLAQADMVVNPSLTEGMPNSLLEALAAGRRW